VFDLYTLYHL